MKAYEINKAKWTFRLAPQLTGKAQQAYAALSTDEADNYEALKKAILRRYNIYEETYCHQFWAAQLMKGGSPRELVTRLTGLVRRWRKECSTFDKLLDLIVRRTIGELAPWGCQGMGPGAQDKHKHRGFLQVHTPDSEIFLQIYKHHPTFYTASFKRSLKAKFVSSMALITQQLPLMRRYRTCVIQTFRTTPLAMCTSMGCEL